jgi:GTP-binding protein
MLVDEAQIYVRSGTGGNGMVHFRREKYVPRGGPDGGDGGRGGDVVLEVQATLNTLRAFRFKQKYIADNGGHGGPKKMSGRSAKDLIIPVPPGTIVRDANTGDMIGDLVEDGQRLIVCKGGRGGRGNIHFVSSRHQAPQNAEKGEPGEERELALELKLIADVGLVGVPNAGKSSFLAAVTNASPKIADYPFTTLEPNLGVSYLDEDTTLIIADIPGLIEGAHMGVGLGDAFLRHVQRTRVIIHLLDGLSEDPISDFSQINSEMALFDPELVNKPQIVVLSKMDLPDARGKWQDVKKEIEALGYEVMSISSVAHMDLKPLLWRAHEVLGSLPEVEPIEVVPVYRPEEDPNDFTVEPEDGGWRIHGKAIERAAAMTYWEHRGSARRFQRLLETLGIDDALREAGIQNGDSVLIDDYELEWQD